MDINLPPKWDQQKMTNKHFLFSNHTAYQSFYTLVCGAIIIFIAAVFVVNEIQFLATELSQTLKQASKVSSLIEFNQTTPAQYKIKPLIMLADTHIPSISDSNNTIDEAKQVLELEPIQIQRLLASNQDESGLRFTPQHVLDVAIHPQLIHITSNLIGFFLIGVMLLGAFIILCFWAIKRLTVPLTELSQATKMFGTDVNAMPMAKTSNSEMNKVVEAFNKMQTRIRKFVQDRTHMLAAISHDLRTPLTRLKLRTEYFSDSPQYKGILEDFEEMESMITSVLLFAREDAYNEPMELFDLEALLDSLYEDMLNAGLNVTYKGLGKRLPFFGRINKLKRAFTNIINNAVKYGQQANVKLQSHDDYIQIEISDKGPGIPEESLEKVFEPFYRVEKSRSPQTGGTGLGLAITKDAISAHGGDIVLRNLAKGGLRVTITLPTRTKS